MKGYVYALINSSLKGLVKVGKTTRNPEQRAVELSSATGVPTPFIVGYEILVEDCDAAEIFVHEILGIMGLRLAKNREFFQASLSQVVSALVECQGIYGIDSEDYCEDEEDTEDTGVESIINNLLKEADNYRYGLNGSFENHYEAEKLYSQAVTLGCPLAAKYLSSMYSVSEDLFSIKKAIKYGNIAIQGFEKFILTSPQFIKKAYEVKDDDDDLKDFLDYYDDTWFYLYISSHVECLSDLASLYSQDNKDNNAKIALSKLFSFYESVIFVIVSALKECKHEYSSDKESYSDEMYVNIQLEYFKLIGVKKHYHQKLIKGVRNSFNGGPAFDPYNGLVFRLYVCEFLSFFYDYIRDVANYNRPIFYNSFIAENIELISDYVKYYNDPSGDELDDFELGLEMYKDN